MASEYKVKNVKNFRGMEGYGFNANLYLGSKKVALVMDAAYGGEYDYEWVSKEDERAFNAFLLTLPMVDMSEFGPEFGPEPVTPDVFVGDLVNKFEEEKEMKSWCRKAVTFRLKGDEVGRWRLITKRPGLEAALVAKYGDMLEEILNKRFE